MILYEWAKVKKIVKIHFMKRRNAMKPLYQNPAVGDVSIRDAFWTPYMEQIRCVTLPYVFRKMDESGYIKNLSSNNPTHFNASILNSRKLP